MRTFLLIPAALSLALVAAPAHADTTYQFSGASCQPERAADVALALTDGGGISNLDTAAFPAAPMNVVCPVSGLETSFQTQVELKARLYDGGAASIGGFWQLESLNNGTIWWSSIKYACSSPNGCTFQSTFTGPAYVRWSGRELWGTAFDFSTYSFRAMIPGRCQDQCFQQSWVRAYWTTHTQS